MSFRICYYGCFFRCCSLNSRSDWQWLRGLVQLCSYVRDWCLCLCVYRCAYDMIYNLVSNYYLLLKKFGFVLLNCKESWLAQLKWSLLSWGSLLIWDGEELMKTVQTGRVPWSAEAVEGLKGRLLFLLCSDILSRNPSDCSIHYSCLRIVIFITKPSESADRLWVPSFSLVAFNFQSRQRYQDFSMWVYEVARRWTDSRFAPASHCCRPRRLLIEERASRDPTDPSRRLEMPVPPTTPEDTGAWIGQPWTVITVHV